MNKLSKTQSKKCAIYPVAGGDGSTDWALWRLSLILREISGSLDPDIHKEGPPGQGRAEDALAQLCRDDVREATIRLEHKAKKSGAVIGDIEWKGQPDV